ncbi:MAG TPA: hypothetical protein VGK26_10490 [Thermoanaerobaculia bacterium]|jgi:hypothetical protein
MRSTATLYGSVFLAVGLLAACSSQPSPPPASSPPPGSSSTASPDARKTAFRAAANELSRQVNAPVDSIAGVSQDETTWNDSCLGCPQTGENCAQVLTPGYRVVLRVSDATYEYHTDLGGRAKLCSQH